MPIKMNKRDVILRSDNFKVMRDNVAAKMLQQAKSIQELSKALKRADSPSDLIQRLLGVQFRCADTIQQAGGRIAHVIDVEKVTNR